MKQADAVTRHLLRPRVRPARLSLVIPMYNEESVVPLLREALEHFARELTSELELVLVNDGSSDQTLSYLAEWAAADARVRVLHLSRNFGHQIATTAGLDDATGDAVVIIDADLQDPLGVIPSMIDRYCEGYDVVYGQRESRTGESTYKRFTAWAFYRIMRTMVYHQLPVDVGDFRLISRACLDAVKEMRETHRFLRGMVACRISANWCHLSAAASHRRFNKVSVAKNAGLFVGRRDFFFNVAVAFQHDLGSARGRGRNRRRNSRASGLLPALVYGSRMDLVDRHRLPDRQRHANEHRNSWRVRGEDL